MTGGSGGIRTRLSRFAPTSKTEPTHSTSIFQTDTDFVVHSSNTGLGTHIMILNTVSVGPVSFTDTITSHVHPSYHTCTFYMSVNGHQCPIG